MFLGPHIELSSDLSPKTVLYTISFIQCYIQMAMLYTVRDLVYVLLIQDVQNVSVHLTITVQSLGAQRLLVTLN